MARALDRRCRPQAQRDLQPRARRADFKAKLRILRRSGELASLDAGRESLAEFAAQWWNLEAIPNLERSTLKTYSSHWNFHVLPRLGHLELRKVTPQVIAEFRAELEGDGVGRETIRRTFTMLQGMLARAVEWQQIQTNPVKAVRKPRTRRERAVVPLSPTEIERIRRHLLMKAGCAMRRSSRCSPMPASDLRKRSRLNGDMSERRRCWSSRLFLTAA
jgi:integrase